MAPRPVSVVGPTELPPPLPHTQADLGVGGQLRERELGPRDHVTCYVIAQPGHVTILGRRGGDPPRHRSSDTSVIGGEMRAWSTIALFRGRKVNTTGIRTFLVRKRGRPSIALALGFLLIP